MSTVPSYTRDKRKPDRHINLFFPQRERVMRTGAIWGQKAQLHLLLLSFRNSGSALDSPTGIILDPCTGDTLRFLLSDKLSLSPRV